MFLKGPDPDDGYGVSPATGLLISSELVFFWVIFFLIFLFQMVLTNPSTFWKLRSCNATPQHCWHLEIGSNGTSGLLVFSIILKP